MGKLIDQTAYEILAASPVRPLHHQWLRLAPHKSVLQGNP